MPKLVETSLRTPLDLIDPKARVAGSGGLLLLLCK
jgi:hypothetical protein